MQNTVSLPKADPHNIRWLNNKVWKWQPHLHFFDNLLHEHIKKTLKESHQRKTADEIRFNKALYHKLLLSGQVVTVSNQSFKLEV